MIHSQEKVEKCFITWKSLSLTRKFVSELFYFHIKVLPIVHRTAMNHIYILFACYSFKTSFFFTFGINYYLYTKKNINVRKTAPDRERIHKKIKIPISSFSPSPRMCSNVLLFNEIHSYDEGTRLHTTQFFCFFHTEKTTQRERIKMAGSV